jgi:hypothetical protein
MRAAAMALPREVAAGDPSLTAGSTLVAMIETVYRPLPETILLKLIAKGITNFEGAYVC